MHAWVIELYRSNELHYWAGRELGGANKWSNKPADAVRFARDEDACRVLYDLCEGVGRTAEYVFDLALVAAK